MESQTKHNNLLLEWDWEVFQAPTSLSFSDIPISELSELSELYHHADPSCNQDMFEFPATKNPDNFPLHHQENKVKVSIITTNTKKKRPVSMESSTKSPAGGNVFRRNETLRNKDVLIGFGRNVKPARMEMRDIKERQKRIAACGKDEAVVVVAKGDRSLVVVDGRGGDGSGKGHWRLLRTLRFRSYLSTVLNKASLCLGCFSIPPVTNGS